MKHLLKLTLLLLAVMLPALASAHDIEVDGIYYNINGNEVTAIYRGDSYDSYSDEYSGDVTIPATVTYGGTSYSVTAIGSFAFYGCTGLTSITIPSSVTIIGNQAFRECSSLQTINYNAKSCADFGSSLTNLPFYKLNITSINFGDSVQKIPAYFAYGLTGLTNLTFPNAVTKIGNSAFYGCSGLSSLVFSDNLTSIGTSAFYGCVGLHNISIPNTVTTIGGSAFHGCTGLTSVTIPNALTIISSRTFYGCTSLASVNMSNSVSSIGREAFYECTGLTDVAMSNSITNIGISAFSGCSNLKNMSIPVTITSIGDNAFYGCNSLTGVLDLSSVSSLGKYAFYDCSCLTGDLMIPDGLTVIDEYAFYGCSGLASVTISNTVTVVSNGAFLNCNGLTNAIIPETVRFIGNNAFRNCASLDNVYSKITNPSQITMGSSVFYRDPQYYAVRTLHVPIGSSSEYQTDTKWSDYFGNIVEISPNIDFADNQVKALCVQNWDTDGDGELSTSEAAAVTSLGSVFEYNKNITSFNELQYFIGLSSIEYPAFYGCSGLTSITIPEGVTSIGDYAFEYCSGLTHITVDSNNTVYDSRNNCNAIIKKSNNQLVVGCKNTIIPSSVTSIGNTAFSGCSGLTAIMIPSSVTSIGDIAFYGCSGLTSITIPEGVTSIGDWAFSSCSGLTHITVDSNNTVYDSRNNCNAIIEKSNNQLVVGCKNTIIPSSVTSIGNVAFYGCSGLTSITIPSSVTSIGNVAFYGCSGLTSITIPSSVTSIGDYAFYGCSGLTSITIPSSVTSIGDYAFAYCNGLNDVYSYISNPSQITMGGSVFYRSQGNYAIRTLHVPVGSLAAYQADQKWSEYFGSIVEMTILATSIELNETSAEMTEGNTMQLTATVLPSNATNKTVTWSTNNSSVANVNSNGVVTAISPGTATITARTTDGTNLSSSCVVTVISNQVNYDNYLSIDDIEVFHGDTIVIPVKMTNETSIISFQTDIYLPEGLELLQEDGEYLIDPSERMTRTHSIMSNDVSSGAVRVICYSSNYKPFTGNSGDDLFYITVKVADDAEGIYTIQLKNTLLTTSDFVELAAPDVAANVNVKSYLLGDANNSGTVTVTDVVVTSQYVLELNPQPFVFEAADVNTDGNITVTDVSRIAWMVLNPAMNAPLRAPALWNNGDRMTGEDITLTTGETRRVSILLDNEMDYSAFQLDLNLPDGLTASNFQLTDRAGNHAFDVNTLQNGNIRALCYSPSMTGINGHEGALLTFDVTATGVVTGDILVDGIELVTTDCQTVRLDDFSIAVNNATSVNEQATGKIITKVEYFNIAGQRLERLENGVNFIVTTYTDGTCTTQKIVK